MKRAYGRLLFVAVTTTAVETASLAILTASAPPTSLRESRARATSEASRRGPRSTSAA